MISQPKGGVPVMIDFQQIFETLGSGILGQLLYPLYLVLVFLTTYYLALLP